MFDQDLEAEVIKVTESKGAVDDAPDGAIDAFHKALGSAVIEIVEELIPPIGQGVDKSFQVAAARRSGLPYPSSQEPWGLGAVGDPVTDSAEFLFEQVDDPQFRRCLENHLQFFFFLCLQLTAFLEQYPVTSLQPFGQRPFSLSLQPAPQQVELVI